MHPQSLSEDVQAVKMMEDFVESLAATSESGSNLSTLTFYSSNIAFFSGFAAFDKALLDATVERWNAVFGYNHSRYYKRRISADYSSAHGKQHTIYQSIPSILQFDSGLTSPL